MSDVIGAAADGTARGEIHQIENQWRMYGNSGMQTARRLPGAITNAADVVAVRTGRLQRQSPPVAGDAIAFADQAGDANLHALDRRIHVARSGAASRFFTEHVPGFDGLAKFDFDTAVVYASVNGKAELDMWREPFGFMA